MIHDPNYPINQIPLHLQAAHWSRHLLLGRGIVCGLNIQVQEDCTFQVCGGVGVTSDGTLVTTDKKNYRFTHYRPFSPPVYPLFQREGGDFYPVWEVLEGRPYEQNRDVLPLTPQNEEEEKNLFLKDKVLVLFLDEPPTDDPLIPRPPKTQEELGPINPPLEQSKWNEPAVVYRPAEVEEPSPVYEPQPTTETATSEIPYQLRWLLMRQADVIESMGLTDRVLRIVGKRRSDDDYTYSDAYSDLDDQVYEVDVYQAADTRLDCGEIPLRRFGWGCLDPFDCEPEELDASQFPHIQTLDDIYNQYVCIIDAATKALDKEAKKLQQWLVDHFYCFAEADWEDSLAMLCQKWEAFKALNKLSDTSQHRKENAQYFYDWCRDLLAAYHELRREVLDWQAECCPDVQAHTRHLLLGIVMRASEAYFPAALRHHYLQPPVFNDSAARAERIRLYHSRFLMLIKGFYLPYSIPDDSINPYCACEEAGEEEELPTMNVVKVTPGRFYDQALGLQSIPYYYPLTESRFSVHRFWEAFRSRSLRIDHHRSYHARMEDGSYSLLPRTTHPLRYNIDTDDFFRIEGHIGWTKTEVEPVLEKWRRKYNLSFDLLYRQINDLTEENVSLDGETFHTFQNELQGAKHLAGVLRGGTFILVYDGNGTIVADFSLPYRCCGPKDETPPPPPPIERDVAGQVIDCNEMPIPGIEVMLGALNAITDLEGIFKARLNPGNYVLKISHPDYLPNPYEQTFEVTSDEVSFDLGILILMPAQVTVNGRIRRGDNAMEGVPVFINLPDGTQISDTTDVKGEFTLNGVSRAVNSISYLLDNTRFDFPINLAEVCDSIYVDINISDAFANPVVVNVDTLGLLNDAYLSSVDVRPGSVAAVELGVFYKDRFDSYAQTYNDTIKRPGIGPRTNIALVGEQYNRLLNDTTLSTTQLHNAYKAANKALDEELLQANEADKKQLTALGENLSSLYLDRIAISQPDKVTTGTTNALTDAGKIGNGVLDINRVTTNWSRDMNDKVRKTISDSIKKFRI